MKIVMLSNFINHHQAPVADELSNIPGVYYWFIETMALPEEKRDLGYPDLSSRPYVIQAYKSDFLYHRAINLINEADVVVKGSAPEIMIKQRIHANKLIFRYSERWFKTKAWFALGPVGYWNIFREKFQLRNKNIYMLAASAYTANDLSHFGLYRNKIYKWGYFPKVGEIGVDLVIGKKSFSPETRIMWCSRFLDWKHPELPVLLAKKLIDNGYHFHLDMYGQGVEFEKILELANKLQVTDVVSFKGSNPNEVILQAMLEHDVFLFTSDKGEGWGAVLNEAMSQGCAVVASNLIGAAPFLIEDGKNGLLFNSEDIDSLFKQTKTLLDDTQLRLQLSQNAVKTMQEVWSPKVAANRIIDLSQRLLKGQDTQYTDGPCSKAYPI